MSASPEAQETIGNYTIERSLAQGSMGHVYVARHALTHARVALKVLRADLTADTQVEERFLREVRAAAHIGHDGIVKVHDAGRSSDGRLYLAMELLSGETLEERLERQRGARLVAMDWLLRVLEPLEAAHAQGIVHRDLKPANVFIARHADGSEHIKLLDFGLARDTREKSGTETGIAMGTPYYMSPEQATRPKHVGPASDVWSIGVMMYEVLSGHMPFEGETLHAIVIQSSTMAHVPLALREPLLDDALCSLVDDCLAKDPALRPADANALAARLTPLLEDPTVRADLEAPSAADKAMSDDPAPLRLEAMPFADTAISLSPRLLESDVRAAPRRSTRGLWISALAALTIATVGFIWALGRADDKRTRDEAQPSGANPAATAPAATKRPDRAEPAAPPTAAKPAAAPDGKSNHGPEAMPSAPGSNRAVGPGMAQPPSATTPESATAPPSAAEPALQQPTASNPDISGVSEGPIAEPVEETPQPSDLPPPDPPEPDPGVPVNGVP
jgi:serine/threonine-protein kinase